MHATKQWSSPFFIESNGRDDYKITALAKKRLGVRRNLPTHDHIGFDGFACSFEIGARFVHVQANGMHFVARGL